MKNYSRRSLRSITEIHVLETDQDTMTLMVNTMSNLIAIERSVMDQKSSQPAAAASSDSRSTHPKDMCVICREEHDHIAPKTLSCGHVFCAKCINDWLKTKPTCPTCNTIQGIIVGNQPVGGTMKMTYSFYGHLPGSQTGGYYTIDYAFLPGNQTVRPIRQIQPCRKSVIYSVFYTRKLKT